MDKKEVSRKIVAIILTIGMILAVLGPVALMVANS